MLHNFYENSGLKDWDQKEHAKEFLIYPENIGRNLAIDETSLSTGELYTYVTNKDFKGKQGTLVASIKGTSSATILKILELIPLKLREAVETISLDMAKNMESAARRAFPNAKLITDKFHIIKLAFDALQSNRTEERWLAMDAEINAMKQAKLERKKYKSEVFANGETAKQLLAHSRFAFFKTRDNWKDSQKKRMEIIFELYPKLERAYEQTMRFRKIFDHTERNSAKTAFLKWIEDTVALNLPKYNTLAKTVMYHLENICNYFEQRLTNANAESFNSKIKLFRANLRGVTNIDIFQFRIQSLFAYPRKI